MPSKWIRHLSLAWCISIFAVVAFGASAQVMSSSNYKVQADSLNVGGNSSTSTNYSVTDTIGETATGEGLSSANFTACSGFECFQSLPYVSFSVAEGTSSPGTPGGSINFGTLSLTAVSTSDGSTINSVFVAAQTNSTAGSQIQVTSANSGLARLSAPTQKISSATATLSAGVAGYGVCVFSSTQGTGSPTALTAASPYNGSCTKTTGHAVGIVDTTHRTVLSTTGALQTGTAEILVKASPSVTTPAGADYQDTLTFTYTVTY